MITECKILRHTQKKASFVLFLLVQLHFHKLWIRISLLHRFSSHWLRRQVNVMSAGSSLSIVFFPIARLLIVFLWISTVSYCKTGIPVASRWDILWPGALAPSTFPNSVFKTTNSQWTRNLHIIFCRSPKFWGFADVCCSNIIIWGWD